MTDEVTQVRRRRRLSRLTLTLLFVAIIVLAMIRSGRSSSPPSRTAT